MAKFIEVTGGLDPNGNKVFVNVDRIIFIEPMKFKDGTPDSVKEAHKWVNTVIETTHDTSFAAESYDEVKRLIENT